MYVMNCTWQDIAYVANKLSIFTNSLRKYYWKAIVKVLRYLRCTLNYGLHYTRYLAVLEGFSDVNWIFDIMDTKSTSGYVFIIAGGVASWESSKQTCITRSRMESKFIALDKVGEEAEWLHKISRGHTMLQKTYACNKHTLW